MSFPNVNSEVRAVAAVVAWHWELEQQQQLLLGPLQASEGGPAVQFLLSCLLGLISQVDMMLLSIFWLATWRLCNSTKFPLVSKK